MFPITLAEFKIQQEELHRRAAKFRLLKSLQSPNPVAARLTSALGRILIQAGQGLLRETGAAQRTQSV